MFNVSSPAVSRIHALSACHRFSRLNSLFCPVPRASPAPFSSPPPLTVSHTDALASARRPSRRLGCCSCPRAATPAGPWAQSPWRGRCSFRQPAHSLLAMPSLHGEEWAERPCLARSTSQARSPRSPAAAARRPARGSARARSGPCATANPVDSTHASCHRHQRCQSAAPPPLCTKFRSERCVRL
jgi:hypothetical protein